MKYGLSLLLLLPVSILSAQKELKYDISKNTGDTIFSSPEKKMYTAPGGKNAVGEYLKSTIYRVNGSHKICFSIQTGRSNIFSIGAGSEALITLQDGKEVSLESSGDHRSRSSVLNYGSYVFAYYYLPKKAMKDLSSSPIKTIRIQASLGPMDYDIKEKFSKTIMEQLERF